MQFSSGTGTEATRKQKTIHSECHSNAVSCNPPAFPRFPILDSLTLIEALLPGKITKLNFLIEVYNNRLIHKLDFRCSRALHTTIAKRQFRLLSGV